MIDCKNKKSNGVFNTMLRQKLDQSRNKPQNCLYNLDTSLLKVLQRPFRQSCQKWSNKIQNYKVQASVEKGFCNSPTNKKKKVKRNRSKT